jgi:hypothetical protein
MAVFTVHQPPLRKGDNAPDTTRFSFVRDGFYVWGFLLSVLWMLRHRLWLVAVLFVALTALIEVGLRYAGVGSGWRALVFAALSFLVGLEGATLRRWALSLKGYTPVGVVIADNADEAERRFFLGWTSARQAKPAASAISSAPPEAALRARHPSPSDVIGSFPQPEPRR